MISIFQLLIPLLAFVLMFIVGTGLSIRDFQLVASKPRSFAGILFIQITVIPGIALLLCQFSGLPQPIQIGILLISICPAGAVSNTYTRLAYGNAALSVALTGIASLIALISMPVLAALLISSKLDLGASSFYLKVALQLALFLCLPVCLGMLVRHKKTDWVNKNNRRFDQISIVGIIAIILAALFSHLELLKTTGLALLGAALIFTLLMMGLGLLTAKILKLEPRDGKTIMIEFPVRNLAIAALISISVLQATDYLLFAAVFALVQGGIMTMVIISSRYSTLKQSKIGGNYC
ncbi:bile acid:sodium symporter family protein [Agaribacterium sp. ZY112]|uniref:bile acid:sodium symporter family protein n=1 Tax=Agaribacterium sp. ZY112 TaxID=3233574 RepID=UPI00352536EB